MGMTQGIFVVDTHVHGQRHAFKFRERGIKPDYATLAMGMPAADVEVYDNSPRLLYHMERYGVDVAILIASFGMTNELNLAIMDQHPGKFVALCNAVRTQHRARRGTEKWTIEAAVKELDDLLATGKFCGIGEVLPGNHEKAYTWNERFEELCQILEVARKHKVPVDYHTGHLSGYGGAVGTGSGRAPEFRNVLHCHELASAYPDVPIILAHGGMQGWWGQREFIEALEVAAAHPNVYLETGLYWAEMYEKPLSDPNIGAEKLVWGTDWGASIPQQWMPGSSPKVYADQNRKLGPPAHQVDVYGWQFRELSKLQIPQDDLNLILGGNAVRLFNIETPHTRLFKEYLQ
ncbi:MAG: amidohydrolase [Chloroflexota bacterium]|nr:amidohydrolase [Chloroflexota bacterium]